MDNSKKCKECGELGKKYETGRLVCRDCRNNARRELAKDGRYKLTDNARGRGVTKEHYKKCMNTSDVCEICEGTDRLCYDHNHNTGKFRGVLCHKCNASLGGFGDDMENLRKAIKYLEDRGSYSKNAGIV